MEFVYKNLCLRKVKQSGFAFAFASKHTTTWRQH